MSVRFSGKLIFGLPLLGALLAAGFVLTRGQSDEGIVLARADGIEVSAEAFRDRYREYVLATGVRDTPRLRKAILDDLVATRLLVREERRSGIEVTDDYRFRSEIVRRKLLLDAYVHNVLFDTLSVREDEVREMFLRSQTRLDIRHLYARTLSDARILRERLLQGESFDELAREVFRDPALRDNGGRLGQVSFDDLDPDLEDAAFDLKIGGISEPVRTAYGYSIIRLDDRFTNPIITEGEYAKRRSKLRAFVLERKRQQARRRHALDLAESLDVSFDQASVDRLVQQIRGEKLLGSGEEFDRFAEMPLLAFGPRESRTTWTVGEFRERALYTTDEQRTQVRTRDDLMDFVQGLLVRHVMLEGASRLGLHETREFAEAKSSAMDEYVLDFVRERLAAQASVPEDSLRSYFSSAPPEEFVQPSRIRLREILISSRGEAEEILRRMPESSFEALAAEHTLRPGGQESGGEIGPVPEEQLGPLSDHIGSASAGEVLGPIDVGGYYGLYRIEERLPSRPMTFDEARGDILEMFRYKSERESRRVLYETIRSKHDISIDTDLLYSLTLSNEDES